jgi:hypothetical protein
MRRKITFTRVFYQKHTLLTPKSTKKRKFLKEMFLKQNTRKRKFLRNLILKGWDHKGKFIERGSF